MPVSDTENASTSEARFRLFVVRRSSRLHRFDGQRHLAVMA